MMKQFIPAPLKFALWFIFKSPQRKLGYHTLWSDVKGLFFYCRYYFVLAPKDQKMSICIGNYNRSAMIRNYLLPALNKLERQQDIELVITDFNSLDGADLKLFLEANWKGTLRFIAVDAPFTRARAINEAVESASHELIFVCDADFSLPSNLLHLCYRFTLANSIWFPIVFYLYKNKQPIYGEGNGEWMQWGGKGLLAIKRKQFLALGGLDQNFTHWGGEDEAFWLQCHQHRKVVIRSRCKGLLHHWHPSFNPKYKKLEELADKGLL